MIPTDEGQYIKVDLTDDETIAMLDARHIPWKRNGAGEVVAVDYANRQERRRARFGGTYKESM